MLNTTRAPGAWRKRLATAGCVALLGAAAGALPASAHAGFPTESTVGFAPNPSGGTGGPGDSPPYVPGSYVTLLMRVPFEQTELFHGADDTTVDVKVVVPAGWTNPSCGTARTQVNDAATGDTNQPGVEVLGWTCSISTVSGHQVLHWTGPQVKAPFNASDSAQFFAFSLTVPSPAVDTTYSGTDGTEGFIVDQTYVSGHAKHWIPDEAFPGTAPVGAETEVSDDLGRTVGGTGTEFHSLAPTRLLDSRTTTGGWNAPLAAGTPNTLAVAGTGLTVPDGADAVVLNVTATNATAASFLTVYPSGTDAPTASNLNFVAGQTIPNLVVVKLGTDGKVAFNVGAGSVDVVVDAVGYFSDAVGDRYNALSPTRVLDSRTPIGGWGTALSSATPKTLKVQGVGGVSNTADAVILNVTATGASAASFLTVYPAGGAAPTASNLNYTAGQSIPNLVVAKVGTNGEIAFAAGTGTVDVVADVVGYFDTTSGDLFHALAPSRILDSRTSGVNGAAEPLVAGTSRSLTVRGAGGVRADATAVFANATVTGPTVDSFVTVYPSGTATPTASNLNFVAGQTIPNLVAVGVGSGGAVSFDNHAGSTQLVVDVVGYFTAPVAV